MTMYIGRVEFWVSLVLFGNWFNTNTTKEQYFSTGG